MRLVVDMNLSPRWATWLSERGHDAVHWSNVGAPDAPDADIMGWAAGHARIVLTHDLDFGDILAATGGAAPSVVQIRAADLAVERFASLVAHALDAASGELARGALVTVDAGRLRIRLLPLDLVRPEP